MLNTTTYYKIKAFYFVAFAFIRKSYNLKYTYDQFRVVKYGNFLPFKISISIKIILIFSLLFYSWEFKHRLQKRT